MIVDNLPISIRVAERAKIAGLKGFHPIGRVLGHVATVKDRVVHNQ
jgi:hypothetical protein